ncbi:MAG: T9SS type A sorting domain-containing protein [Calditrichaeota bacterium]|nr:T9SS type A sorting domain-containing protein [Calditrichota bacterium]MBT7618438.1 T9SS type A sorting domain-containing protein [Calditrichota bacterium]MBT7789443.1 T9SS type A sorting domain-containing protein [Calditrichota bacterium]
MAFGRLIAIDILDINEPWEFEHNLNDELRNITGVEIVNNMAYLANSGNNAELIIVDISDLNNFEVVSRTEGPFGSMKFVTVSGDYAVLGSDRYVFRFDVGDPENPEYLGAYVTEDLIRDIALSEQFLYLAVSEDGVLMLDISDPEDFIEAGFYNTDGKAWDIELGHNIIIVADDTNVGIYENTLLSVPVEPDGSKIPNGFAIYPAFPNPFNSSTTISYELSQPSFVSLNVYNPTGQIITTLKNGYLQNGAHSINWNSGNLPSGLYYITLMNSGRSFSQQVILTR